mgnify:CR=1 FL=1
MEGGRVGGRGERINPAAAQPRAVYNAKIQELEDLDFVEEITAETELGTVRHYLPHAGVLKDEGTTTLRIVMDGSCSLRGELSLNDCLYTGPNLVSDLLECLLGFRCDKFALTADLEKAFLHLILRVMDRDIVAFDPINTLSLIVVFRKGPVFGRILLFKNLSFTKATE